MSKRTRFLSNNGPNWYVVKYTNNRIELRHSMSLSAILECNKDMQDYEIKSIQQCQSKEFFGQFN